MATQQPIYYDSATDVAIYQGECLEVLRQLSPRAAVIVTDPPYGTGGWIRVSAGGRDPSGILHKESWDTGSTDWLRLLPAPFLSSLEAVITFWPASNVHALLATALAQGLTKHRCLYMQKRDPKPMPSNRVRWSVEPIWVLSRDGFQLYGGTDVCETSSIRYGRGDLEAVGHQYQKPLEVMTWLLKKLDQTVPLIIDPFAGSGTTLVAAAQLGIPAIGIESDPYWCGEAVKRLGSLSPGRSTFTPAQIAVTAVTTATAT